MTLKICFFAIIGVVVAAIVKQLRPEFLPYIRIGMTVTVGAFAISVISPLVTYINSLFSGALIDEWGGSIIKALGVAILVQLASDVCRDFGENSAATGVELIGKLEILILCLPMIKKIISTALEVLQW